MRVASDATATFQDKLHMLATPYPHTLNTHSGWVIDVSESHPPHIEHALLQTFLVIYNHYVTVHCQMLLLYICYLLRYQLPTWPFTPTESFFIGLQGRSLFLLA